MTEILDDEPTYDDELVIFAESEGMRQEAAVTEVLVALQREANTLLAVQLLFFGASVGHAVDLMSSSGEAVFIGGAVALVIWLGVTAGWTARRCLYHSDWLPEGTEPFRLLHEDVNAIDMRLSQLEQVDAKIKFNKARTVKLARSLNKAREWTVLSPLGYIGGLLLGLLV